jgi:hypothetical protein
MGTRPPPRRRESDLVREALRFLNRIPGVVVWRTNVGAVSAERNGRQRFVRFGFPGLSDIIGWKEQEYTLNRLPTSTLGERTARFLAIEVKIGVAKLTPQQQGFLDLVNKSGGIAFVARSCEDIAAELGVCR